MVEREDMASQGCGPDHSGSRDVASVEATAPLTNIDLIEALEPFATTWVFSRDRPDARVLCRTENGVLDLPVSAFNRAFEVWSKAGGHAVRDGGVV